MQGFVAAGDSVYADTLRHLRENIVTAQYTPALYKFSDTVIPQGNTLSSNIFSSGFYDQVNTSLTTLLTRIANNTAAGVLSVVVSDFVQSESGTDQLSLASAFQQVVNPQNGTRPEILLLGFRSKFQGLYYVETLPDLCRSKDPQKKQEKDKKCHLKLELEKNELGRPFYVLVIAPSAEALTQFEGYALQRLPGGEAFRPTAPPLVVQKAKLSASPDQPSYWNRRGPFAFHPNHSGPLTLIGTFVEREASSGGVSPLRLKVQIQSHVPLVSPAKCRHQVERATFTVGSRKWQYDLQRVEDFRFLAEGKTDEVTFTYLFPRPAPQTWDLYRIQLQPGTANLQTPAWVREWNTDNDQTPEQGNRTLHLNLLVETMVRAITEKVVFSSQCILLGRGE
jgi:hypothetical protein